MILIDTHSHIHFSKDFPDVEEVLLNAHSAGVIKQVLVGCNMEDSLTAAKFVGAFAGQNSRAGLSWTVGIHPHDALEGIAENFQNIRNLIQAEENYENLLIKPVAIGEIGLDYFRNLAPVEAQKSTFRECLKIALEMDLPVVVHIRDAYADAFQILEEIGNKKVILHCFSGGRSEADLAWNRGYITSFSGVVTYPKNLELQECAKQAPEHLIVVETDCPFLAPQVYRGKRTEPAFVLETARFIAQLRGISLENFAEISTNNAERVLGI